MCTFVAVGFITFIYYFYIKYKKAYDSMLCYILLYGLAIICIPSDVYRKKKTKNKLYYDTILCRVVLVLTTGVVGSGTIVFGITDCCHGLF